MPCRLLALMHKTKDSWCWYPPVPMDLPDPGAKINPLLYGILIEEINYSGEGGLYALTIRRLKTAYVNAVGCP